jgi:hypothetical protein
MEVEFVSRRGHQLKTVSTVAWYIYKTWGNTKGQRSLPNRETKWVPTKKLKEITWESTNTSHLNIIVTQSLKIHYSSSGSITECELCSAWIMVDHKDRSRTTRVIRVTDVNLTVPSGCPLGGAYLRGVPLSSNSLHIQMVTTKIS